jgi:hypothetical protein
MGSGPRVANAADGPAGRPGRGGIAIGGSVCGGESPATRGRRAEAAKNSAQAKAPCGGAGRRARPQHAIFTVVRAMRGCERTGGDSAVEIHTPRSAASGRGATRAPVMIAPTSISTDRLRRAPAAVGEASRAPCARLRLRDLAKLIGRPSRTMISVETLFWLFLCTAHTGDHKRAEGALGRRKPAAPADNARQPIVTPRRCGGRARHVLCNVACHTVAGRGHCIDGAAERATRAPLSVGDASRIPRPRSAHALVLRAPRALSCGLRIGPASRKVDVISRAETSI